MTTPDCPEKHSTEWPTLAVAAICYAGFILTTAFSGTLGMVPAILVLALILTLYSSLNHEVLHGHPFRTKALNTALVFPALGLFIPYPRFRDTHLAHHHDPSLTDPYDDPETNFVDPAVWARWSTPRRAIYAFNNTLLGRMVIGPLISTGTFWLGDVRAIAAGDRRILSAWVFHAAALVPVILWWVLVADMPVTAYLTAAYASLSVLKIRTFLEHRAHEKARCRSVIIEDRGLLSVLFLKNNLHAVHHAFPALAWYRLDRFYHARRSAFLQRNGGYAYASYWQIARLFLLRVKDPVPHSLWDTADVPARPPAARENTAA